ARYTSPIPPLPIWAATLYEPTSVPCSSATAEAAIISERVARRGLCPWRSYGHGSRRIGRISDEGFSRCLRRLRQIAATRARMLSRIVDSEGTARSFRWPESIRDLTRRARDDVRMPPLDCRMFWTQP